MKIKNMTRKDFEEFLKNANKIAYETVIDEVILYPTNRKHESGYKNFIVICGRNHELIGYLTEYDVFILETKDNRSTIDLLPKSTLFRIWFNKPVKVGGWYNVED